MKLAQIGCMHWKKDHIGWTIGVLVLNKSTSGFKSNMLNFSPSLGALTYAEVSNLKIIWVIVKRTLMDKLGRGMDGIKVDFKDYFQQLKIAQKK